MGSSECRGRLRAWAKNVWWWGGARGTRSRFYSPAGPHRHCLRETQSSAVARSNILPGLRFNLGHPRCTGAASAPGMRELGTRRGDPEERGSPSSRPEYRFPRGSLIYGTTNDAATVEALGVFSAPAQTKPIAIGDSVREWIDDNCRARPAKCVERSCVAPLIAMSRPSRAPRRRSRRLACDARRHLSTRMEKIVDSLHSSAVAQACFVKGSRVIALDTPARRLWSSAGWRWKREKHSIGVADPRFDAPSWTRSRRHGPSLSIPQRRASDRNASNAGHAPVMLCIRRRTVVSDAQKTNSRWASTAGIYRQVRGGPTRHEAATGFTRAIRRRAEAERSLIDRFNRMADVVVTTFLRGW